MDKYPANKPTEYTVALLKAIDFGNAHTDWEAALTAVQFTQGWNNFTKDCDLRFLVKLPNLPTVEAAAAAGHQELFLRAVPYNDYEEMLVKEYVVELGTAGTINPHDYVYYKATVRANYFTSVRALLDHVSKLFDLAFHRYGGASLDFEVDVNTGYVKFMAARCTVLILSDGTYFADLLGLPNKELKSTEIPGGRQLRLHEVVLAGTRKPQLDLVNSMWVYTDVIEQQPVGDTEAPLLGIVPVGGVSSGQRVHYSFNPLSFIPVSKCYFKTINIRLATEHGDPVPFAHGSDNVVCWMRFRQKQANTHQQPFVL